MVPKAIVKAKRLLEELDEQLEAKEAELQSLLAERDASTNETEDALQQIEQLNSQLEAKTSEIESSNTAAFTGEEVREEAELTLLQLHQVQEELEHYFLYSEAGDQLAEAQQHQLSRAQTLMGRLLPVAAQSHSNRGETIDVITPDVMNQSQMSVQTDALLTSYQKNLHRAAALLQRAIRS